MLHEKCVRRSEDAVPFWHSLWRKRFSAVCATRTIEAGKK